MAPQCRSLQNLAAIASIYERKEIKRVMIQHLQQAHVIIKVPHLIPGGSHHEQSVHAALQLQKYCVITCAMSINNSQAS